MPIKYQMLQFTCTALFALGAITATTWHELCQSDELMDRLGRAARQYYPYILIGDSVIRETALTDKEKKSVVEYLQDITHQAVLDVSRSGIGLSTFAKILEYYPTQTPKAQLLILEVNPVNMIRAVEENAFMNWQQKLSMALEHENILICIAKHSYQLDRGMGNCNTTNDPFNAKASRHQKNATTQERYDAVNLRDISEISDINPLLSSILESSNHISNQLFIFITPLDMERLPMLVDKETLEGIQERVYATEATCRELGIPFVNLLNAIPDSSHFTDEYHDHLNDEGRRIIAQEIAKAIEHEGLSPQLTSQ